MVMVDKRNLKSSSTSFIFYYVHIYLHASYFSSKSKNYLAKQLAYVLLLVPHISQVEKFSFVLMFIDEKGEYYRPCLPVVGRATNDAKSVS